MSYRNKTYIAFASEDITYYRLMEAWKKNENIDFDFLMLMTYTSQGILVNQRRLKQIYVNA